MWDPWEGKRKHESDGQPLRLMRKDEAKSTEGDTVHFSRSDLTPWGVYKCDTCLKMLILVVWVFVLFCFSYSEKVK